MKRGILLNAIVDKGWIGGLYYIKNIAFQLSQNGWILENYNIYLITPSDYKYVFEDLPDSVKLLGVLNDHFYYWKRKYYIITKKIKFSYPRMENDEKLGAVGIEWIADFQDNYFPEYFTDNDLKARSERNRNIADGDRPLVLSSQACFEDFKKYYNPQNTNIAVVRFVSYISWIVESFTEKYENDVLSKHNLQGKKYACIMNQFWQHKNHKVVFEAIDRIAGLDENTYFVCTGLMEDNRNPSYIENLREIVNKPSVAKHLKLLGLIDRKEQLAIMKNAEFVIQPSLFEGWGTVLEDAKVLDKTVLLSDTPIHREQQDAKCVLFNPYNPDELADLIMEAFKKTHNDNVEKGISNMQLRAKEYSTGFEQLIKEYEKKMV